MQMNLRISSELNDIRLSLTELPISKKDRQEFICSALIHSSGASCTNPIIEFCDEFDKSGEIYYYPKRVGNYVYLFLRLQEEDKQKYTLCMVLLENYIKDLFSKYNLKLNPFKAD